MTDMAMPQAMRSCGSFGSLHTQICAGDIVGWLGGEEFGWLLPGATVAEARAAVERFLWQVRTTTPIQEELPPMYSASFPAGLTGRKPIP